MWKIYFSLGARNNCVHIVSTCYKPTRFVFMVKRELLFFQLKLIVYLHTCFSYMPIDSVKVSVCVVLYHVVLNCRHICSNIMVDRFQPYRQ